MTFEEVIDAPKVRYMVITTEAYVAFQVERPARVSHTELMDEESAKDEFRRCFVNELSGGFIFSQFDERENSAKVVGEDWITTIAIIKVEV